MCLNVFVGFGILMFLSYLCLSVHASPMACNASLSESCHASLYYVPETTKSLNETASLFGVAVKFVRKTKDGFLIEISCSCPADHNEFVWHMDYVVQPRDTWESISSKFGSFVLQFPEKTLLPSLHVTLDLLCGCSGSGEMMSYKVTKGDTLYTICSRFKADLNKIARLNGLDNPDLVYTGDVLFIPVPGLQNLIMVDVDNKDLKTKRKPVSRVHIIVGVVAAASVIVLSMVMLLFWKYHRRKRVQQLQESKAIFQQMECLHCFLEACPHHKSSEADMVSSLSSEKATVFPYYEIRDATCNFSTSSKIGQGSYGSVYLGTLRGKEVAIKQMKNTKSREFLSELNILGKVHHPNLIELIGYAAGGNSLFLVYEFAENGALSDHLHRHRFRGCKPLSWTTRVQIALDAAKGLEYIHEHTKPYYVHRDVKTSNILLDSNFHAKIADFGLVKLLEQSPEVRTAASRIVGTFGYLAPEYVRDGCVTTKSDVYSFGVVLMELLTGQPALSQEASPENNYYEHRSLVQYVLAALNDACDPFNQLTKCIDPNLTCYHKDSFFQVALLSKDCVDDNWNQRPDMSTVVVRLSHILSCSKEWEKKKRDCLRA